MSNFNTVKNYDALIKLTTTCITPTEGMVMYCEEEDTHYVYSGNTWNPIKAFSGDNCLNMNLYDMNAQIISQMPAYDAANRQMAIDLINKYASEYDDSYFMLLCKEQSYYTIFHEFMTTDNEFNRLGEAVITICHELGTIHDVYTTTEGTIDIWVKPEGYDIWCLHLFPYDAGVVYYG